MSAIKGFEHLVRENQSLAPYTKLNLGGVAEFFAEPTTQDELSGLVKQFHEHGHTIRLIGRGSNIVVRKEAVAGLVIHLSAPAFCQLEVDGNRLVAGGGAQLSHFVSTCVREGLAGPENLVGIPGSIGGALHSNTGAYGVDIGSWVQSATVLTRAGEILERASDQLSFSYGKSSLDELVILSAEFQFEKEAPEVLTRQLQKLWIVRRASQPISENAIYIFKDDSVETATELIDRAGAKGMQVGAVEVSERDPNLFVAGKGATSEDVLKLMEMVQNQVQERVGVEIEPAVQIW